MASDSTSFEVPWRLLLPLFALIAGASIFIAKLPSQRPAADGGAAESIGYAQIDARLWQDPFKAANTAIGSTGNDKLGPAFKKEEFIASIRSRMRTSNFSGTTENAARILLMPVMVSAAPYADVAEQRLRTRVAVLSGLARCGYNPEDTTHIAAFKADWDMKSLDVPGETDLIPNGQAVVPYEWMRAASMPMAIYGVEKSPVSTPKYDRVLVVWLNEDLVVDRPVYRIGSFLRSLFKDLKVKPIPVPKRLPAGVSQSTSPTAAAVTSDGCVETPMDVRILGPRASTTLRAMAWDVKRQPERKGLPEPQFPAEVEFICATASAEERALLDDGDLDIKTLRDFNDGIVDSDYFRDYLKNGFPRDKLKFFRIAANDRELSQTLAQELLNRGINVTPNWTFSDGERIPDYRASDHIAVIAEWDTFFGRALPLSFSAVCSGQKINDLARWQSRFPVNIHPYVYLRGIDGQTANRRDAVSGNRASTDESGKNDPVKRPVDPPEGTSQSDYLRRLADQLSALDSELRYRGKRLRAVGVLGTDVYDKLMILNALRAQLPGVVFFTTDLDARFGMPTEWNAAHNLVIASSYGQRLHQFFQGGIPPFRDAYQTATFAATLAALDMVSPEQLADRSRSSTSQPFVSPRLFEISRDGPYELSEDLPPVRNQIETIQDRQGRPSLSIHPPRPDLRGFWQRGLRWQANIVFSILAALAAILIWYLITDKKRGARSVRAVTWEILANSYLCVPVIVILTGMVIWALHGSDGTQSEPFSLLNGISAWPTEIARVSAAILVVYFLIRAECARCVNNREIKAEFLFTFPSHGRPLWSIVDGYTSVDADEIWSEYLRQANFIRRLVIAAGLAIPFTIFGIGIIDAFGWPAVPMRGENARLFDDIISRSVVIFTTAFFVVYVMHSAIVNLQFISALVKGQTEYPEHAFERALGHRLDNIPSKSQDVLDKRTSFAYLYTEWMDIRLIARRTEIVGRSVYHPMLIFAMLTVSRTSLFDDWDWPLGLVIVFAIAGSLTVLAAGLLRVAAERARSDALAKLNQRRHFHAARNDAAHLKIIDEVSGEIRSERGGAFAVLSQYPWLTAVLIPSGGIGLWAILERLPQWLQ
ncbi:MAG: hypothetical protein QM754_06825 [Tepidisphaeraceae bacterium]